MNENIKNNINYISKGIIISFIMTFLLLIILSVVLTYTSVSENIETSAIIIINAISILIGSSISTMNEKNKGILKGLITGTLYIGIVYLISSIISMQFSLNMNSIIIILTSMFVGALGGIIGVNVKK